MFRLVQTALALALLAGLLLVPAPATDASTDWCWDDPVVNIGGRSVSINIGVQGRAAEVRANVHVANVMIYVPRGMLAYLSVAANVYFREKVQFVAVDGGALIGQPIPVKVVVTFESAMQMPAAMRITRVLSLRDGSTLTSSTTFGTTSDRLEASFSLE